MINWQVVVQLVSLTAIMVAGPAVIVFFSINKADLL